MPKIMHIHILSQAHISLMNHKEQVLTQSLTTNHYNITIKERFKSEIKGFEYEVQALGSQLTLERGINHKV
jgi:hypothetical protein